METTVKEIAAVLRSTDDMADQFARRVQERVGQPVSFEEILAVMEKISAKRLSLERVVAKVQEQQTRASRRSSRRAPTPSKRSAQTVTGPRTTPPSPKPKTIHEKLQDVLRDNWDRAEAEGLQPDRMTADAFINAVYQFTDRREATRQRILQAATLLDKDDILLTPALVADSTHKLFQG